jgi:hypothetical protein
VRAALLNAPKSRGYRGTHLDGVIYPFWPMGGGAEGYSDTRDLTTLDGVPIREVYDEVDALLGFISEARQRAERLFVVETTEPNMRFYQEASGVLVERGAEYGRPSIQRPRLSSVVQGLPIESFKIATGWTREYIAKQRADRIRRDAEAYARADQKFLWQLTLQTLFDDLAGSTKTFVDDEYGSLTVRAPLANGDGVIYPEFENTTFASNHDHYFVSGNTQLTAANITTLQTALEEHGHRDNKILIINKAERDDIEALTAFVPREDALVRDPNLVFARVGEEYIGVIKNTGFRVAVWNLLPAGYVVAINDYGEGDDRKPIARREWPAGHALRGLQLIRPDRNNTYPVEQTFYERWIGMGGNYRTNGAVMQVTAGSYTVPTILTLREG